MVKKKVGNGSDKQVREKEKDGECKERRTIVMENERFRVARNSFMSSKTVMKYENNFLAGNMKPQ